AGDGLPGRGHPGGRRRRRPGGRLPGVRRVLDDRGGRGPRLDRPGTDHPRVGDLDPPGRRGDRAHLLGGRAGRSRGQVATAGGPGAARSRRSCHTGAVTEATTTPRPRRDPYPDGAPASEALFRRALGVIPGGVNSPVRAFRAVGGTPRFMVRGAGPVLYDADGREDVDLVCSWGPMILGHAHPDVLGAVTAAAAAGFSFGTPTEREVLLAEEIIARVDAVQQVRLVSSGTEATMSALRLARGFTGRARV